MRLLDSLQDGILYLLTSIDYIEQASTFPVTDEQRLIVIASGQGVLYVNDLELPAPIGSCFILAPQSDATLQSTSSDLFGIYVLSYREFHIKNGQESRRIKNASFGGRISLLARPYSRLFGLIKDMIRPKQEAGTSGGIRHQILFYELMAFLLEQNTLGGSPEEAKDAVKRSITFLQQNYREKWTVKELAQWSGVALWQYSPLFQSLTGQTPLDYLTEIRLNRAKELLLQTEESVEEIAHSVGFNDPYYFTRRFRQKTGSTPRQYVLQQKQQGGGRLFRDSLGQVVALPEKKSRIVYYDGKTFGDLFALGLNAVGGSLWLIDANFPQEEIQSVKDIGFPLDPGKVKSLDPDMIILANYVSVPLDELNAIAPTIVLDQNRKLENRLRILGELLEKQQEAEQWLLRYEAQSEYMWSLCAPLIRPGESASVFTFAYHGNLYVMATQGLPNTLYHPLGFHPPKSVGTLRDAGEPFRCIREEELSNYAGDRIFVALPPPQKDPISYQAALRLMQSSLWNELPAVQNGLCTAVDAHWNYEDAATRSKLLHALPAMLRNT